MRSKPPAKQVRPVAGTRKHFLYGVYFSQLLLLSFSVNLAPLSSQQRMHVVYPK